MRMSSAMNVPVRPTPALERRERGREGGRNEKKRRRKREGGRERGRNKRKEGEGGGERGREKRKERSKRERNENDNVALKKKVGIHF